MLRKARGSLTKNRKLRSFSRRSVLTLFGGAAFGQGISSRGVRPVPRGKPSGVPFHAQFTDVAEAAGLRHTMVYGGVDRKDYILETVGSGVAFLDYDNDGWMDLFVLCGSRLDGSPAGATNRLYKNNRDGTFRDVTEESGLWRTGWAAAVTVGDYDNDGYPDIFLTSYGQNTLYHNNGDGTFRDLTKEAGLLEAQQFGAGCTWVDYNRDGHLDLFVANYLDWTIESAQQPGANSNCKWKGVEVNCGPRGLKPGGCKLYRNNGNGTFTDVSEASGVAAARGYAMTSVAGDFDNDGWPDIYVACDSSMSLLFRNNHDGTFREEGLERGVALSEDGQEQAGMGIGVGDYDLDGDLDLFKTHFADDTSVLYRNDGKGYFDDMTLQAGFGVETRFISWGTGIVDLDNDGLPDIFVATGNVYPEVERAVPEYPMKTPRLIFRNLGGGKFEELIETAGPGISAAHTSRGCAFGDFDNDGDVDILIMNMNGKPSLLRNDTPGDRGVLKVSLVGVQSNRSAIGARVTVRYEGRTQVQELAAQSSFYSVNDPRLHFGLGAAASADVSIRWPNGVVEELGTVRAAQWITVREGKGIEERRPLPTPPPAI